MLHCYLQVLLNPRAGFKRERLQPGLSERVPMFLCMQLQQSSVAESCVGKIRLSLSSHWKHETPPLAGEEMEGVGFAETES